MEPGGRELISAERVRAAARAGHPLVVIPGRTVVTEEARDLAARLGVELLARDPLVEEAQAAAGRGTRGSGERVQVVLGSDHGGYELKEGLKIALGREGYTLRDVGCHGMEAVDYPDFAAELARRVSRGEASRGIMVDSIGVASAMVCNRFPGVRAAPCESMTSLLSSRRHNDANVLTLGAKLIPAERAVEMALAWLREPYDGGRHQRRVEKIMRHDPVGG